MTTATDTRPTFTDGRPVPDGFVLCPFPTCEDGYIYEAEIELPDGRIVDGWVPCCTCLTDGVVPVETEE